MSPRTPEQYQEIRERSRSAIMKAALKLFSAKGYRATTVDKIAQAAGVSKGLLYNYFKSKDELLEEILEKMSSMMQLDDGNDSLPDDPRQRLEELIDYYLSEKFLKDEFWRLFFSLILQPDIMEIVMSKFVSLYHKILEFLVKVFEEAGYENPLAEALIFGATFDGLYVNYLLHDEKFPVEEVKKALIDRYCRNQHYEKSFKGEECETPPYYNHPGDDVIGKRRLRSGSG